MDAPRFTTEQMQADNILVDQLKISMDEWNKELVFLEKELVDQALLDARAGEQSNRYRVLEMREKDVKRFLKEAQAKLTQISNRYNVGPLKNLMTNVLNNLRP